MTKWQRRTFWRDWFGGFVMIAQGLVQVTTLGLWHPHWLRDYVMWSIRFSLKENIREIRRYMERMPVAH
jgi:hypothetical protein